MTVSLLAAARAYAKRMSLWVFPLLPGSKEPNGRLAPNGYQSATTDEGIIGRWWQRDPRAGIGVACAQSGLVVIDQDPRNGGDDTLVQLAKELGPLPTTWTCLTPSGGAHFYFRDAVGEYVGTLGDGVDVKFNGYVVAPPSHHPNGGVYRWDLGSHPLETEIAALPDAWLDRMTSRRSGIVHPSSGDDAALSFLGAAFEHLGWLGNPLPDGKRMARCPWLHEHTDGRGDGTDSSTVLFPRAHGFTLGGFRCAHGHCARRTWRDVMRQIPARARVEASAALAARGFYADVDGAEPDSGRDEPESE